jgi:TRAP-type C4-dicarboxylate transport system substrate-binding protein
MIKKIIILAVLIAAGYVGYLVWNNLTDREKATVTEKVKNAAEKGKNLAKDAADTITEKFRGDGEPDRQVTRDQLAPRNSRHDDIAPPPRQPGKVVIPME